MQCYRHPDREAYVRCQRCERFICPACQIESAVGFLCPEDAPKVPSQLVTKIANLSDDKLVTKVLIALCTLVWFAQVLIPNDVVTLSLAYAPFVTQFEPWRMITTGFLHATGSPLHLGLNMYSLWIFGSQIEPLLGRLRFILLYVISLFAGSVGVLWLSTSASITGMTVGASGAIFGLMGSYLVIARSLGGNSSQATALIAINLAFSFMLPGVSWQAHVGGLLGGLAVAGIYSKTRGAVQQLQQRVYLIALVVGLVLITVLGVSVKLAGIF